jgi:hypothetical protein
MKDDNGFDSLPDSFYFNTWVVGCDAVLDVGFGSIASRALESLQSVARYTLAGIVWCNSTLEILPVVHFTQGNQGTMAMSINFEKYHAIFARKLIRPNE